MSEMVHFEIVGDQGEYRPTGQVSFSQAIQLVGSAIAFAREQHLQKLLVVTSGLTGFGSPNLAERYLFVGEWARAANYIVRVAVVALPGMIDRGKFGAMAAASSSFTAGVFESEEEALSWLKSLK